MSHKIEIIAISGPTGIGKTALAIELAKRLSCEIISFDSRQIYQELKIGVARPSEEELAAVKHHFIGHRSIHLPYTVHDYVVEVQEFLNIQSNELGKRKFIMVGGTGLYLHALSQGLDDIPNTSSEIRKKLEDDFKNYGLGYFQEKLKSIDPISYKRIDISNPRRIQRIIEIWEEHGKVYSEIVQQNSKSHSSLSIKNILLEMPREELYHRIHLRVNQMIENGLVSEVESLINYKHLQALNTVGYKEIFSFLEGQSTLEEAIEKIKQHSRNYAKRQITWNKKYLESVYRLIPNDIHRIDKIEEYVIAEAI